MLRVFKKQLVPTSLAGTRRSWRGGAQYPLGNKRFLWWGKGDSGESGHEKNNDREGNGRGESGAKDSGRKEQGADSAVAFVGEGEDAPKPQSVMAVPLVRRPLFPHGQHHPLNAHHLPTMSELKKIGNSSVPYVGAFLYKEEHSDGMEVAQPLTDVSLVHPIGTLAQVHLVPHRQDMFSPDDGETGDKAGSVLVRGHRRVRILDVAKEGDGVVYVNVEHLDTPPVIGAEEMNLVTATGNAVMEAMRDLIKINPGFREQLSFMYTRLDPKQDPGKFADFVASLLTAGPNELQEAFATMPVKERLDCVLMLLMKEIEISKLQDKIRQDVEEKVQGEQRKYMLREQLKSIEKELGIKKDDKEAVVGKFMERLEQLEEIPEDAKKVIDEELEKLASLEKNSSEFNVTRNYLDWLTSIPWGEFSDENFDVDAGHKILEEDHYGMEDAKERILEFIAIGKLKGNVQGKIICLAGPPGVGKTSIGKSIARALNREYYRFSVGGLGDVAEIKGHRRTYVGAMPGKIVQAVKSTKTFNPLILIDEIDKLGRGHAGDPASALLELLDPSQNQSFVDHYLDVPLDMSKALFVCTANNLDTIPGPLLDRMEVITLSGYDLPEKVQICEKYLEPKAREEVGLQEGSAGVPSSMGLERPATESLIRWYCREAGVRNLQKQVEKMYRKLAFKVVKEKPSESDAGWAITEDKLTDFLGKAPFSSDRLYEEGTPPGVVMGLAYTAMGGSALYIETAGIHNEGKAKKMGGEAHLMRTGQLGEVMNESSSIAMTNARKKLRTWDPSNSFFENSRIHLHVPEGAIKKDGPSAGITMTTALLSLAMDRPIRGDLAMTGEISLTGKVLPVGGIKEKTIAARRAGVNCLILPAENQKDFDELPEYIQEDLEVHFCDEYDDVFDIAFGEDRFFDL